MVSKDDILEALNPHLTRVLDVVALVAPDQKFQVCRKLILDEFGREGFGKDLEALLARRNGTERHGTGGPIPRKEGGAP